MFIWLLVILAVIFLFFPKFLYRFLSFYFKNFRFTIPITVGLVAGHFLYELLETTSPSGYYGQIQYFAKPILMVFCAGGAVVLMSDFLRRI